MSREEYVRKLLEAYRTTPGTTGSIRRPDRVLAAQLHQRGVPLLGVENALVLAVTFEHESPVATWGRGRPANFVSLAKSVRIRGSSSLRVGGTKPRSLKSI